ncbi:CDK5RAP1-like protein [Smittium mucronatum]|uniref:CDK5RAP1-like protein n=1 Tax=Smittium mucronatum TaxID=133383 RepID=A0A1R0GW76_9FUNG|nr:CDK5RAP1-like protein [Smittium mucronatum]
MNLINSRPISLAKALRFRLNRAHTLSYLESTKNTNPATNALSKLFYSSSESRDYTSTAEKSDELKNSFNYYIDPNLSTKNKAPNTDKKAGTPKNKRQNIVFNNRTGPSLQHFLSNSINLNSIKNKINTEDYEEDIPYLSTKDSSEPIIEGRDFDWGQGRTYYVEVYGCQMNVSDTEILMSILESSGYKRSLSSSAADILFLMTCSIREKAENKIWSRLREIKATNIKTRKSNPQKVGVLGCMAERLKDKLLEQDKLVDVVCGPDAYRSLPRLLSLRSLTNQGVANVILSADETYADISPVRIDPNQISVHLSIMR